MDPKQPVNKSDLDVEADDDAAKDDDDDRTLRPTRITHDVSADSEAKTFYQQPRRVVLA